MQYEIGDIVHARGTQDWYGLIMNIVGKDAYVQWFEKEYERNGWFHCYMLEKISQDLDNLNEKG